MRLPSAPYKIGNYAIRPHPLAPAYNTPESALLTFQQVVEEIRNLRGNPSKEGFDLIRQTGYVSLWFFLRCILGATGPYESLNDPLSIDMCNFRQSDFWEGDGCHGAAFIPRGFWKSTIFTHGGDTWDLLRDPEERILIANAIDSKAGEFLHMVERNFDSNELMEYFYPEYCDKKLRTINDKYMILPNRKRNYVEPSIRSIGMTGAAEGGHYTMISIDDLIGLDGLNQERNATVVMDTAKKWMNTNLKALRVNEASRIGLVATRYAIDDCYQTVYTGCRSVTGWKKGDLQAVQGGIWDVYYRLVEEDGIFLRPSVMNKESFAQLLKDDFWSAMTQYMNAPMQAGLAEFAGEEVRKCILRWDDKAGEYWIVKCKDANWDDASDEVTEVRLGSCDIVMSTDFAATDTGISSKTNRTSIGIWARDCKDNFYRIWSRVGFFNVYQIVDFIFEGHKVFPGNVRITYIETNAFQKIMKVILETEEKMRGEWINPCPVNVGGDKFARIRAALGPKLIRKQIWATVEAGLEFTQELKMFPMNRSRVDVLDESEKALTFSVKPMDEDERRVAEEEEERYTQRNWGNATGY